LQVKLNDGTLEFQVSFRSKFDWLTQRDMIAVILGNKPSNWPSYWSHPPLGVSHYNMRDHCDCPKENSISISKYELIMNAFANVQDLYKRDFSLKIYTESYRHGEAAFRF